MKRLLLITAVVLLAGCETMAVKKEIEIVTTPVPFCPAPPDFNVTKEHGLEHVTPESSPGEVAKAYEYEVTYQRGVNDIQATIIEMYKRNAVDTEKLKSDIQKMIDETNSKLKSPSTPSQ